MNNIMQDLVNKEVSDKYSEICSDIGNIINKYESDFETIRELEYWVSQALYSVSVRKRISNRK